MADSNEWGICDHKRRENVYNYGNDIIAIRCKSCAQIICPVGRCPGCKKDSYLHHAEGRVAYCTRDCYLASKAEERAARKKEDEELLNF